MKPVYFRESCAVSAQNSYQEPFLTPLLSPQEGKYKAIEPDYLRYMPAMQTRRMNRMLKMALYAGLDCLARSRQPLPDGVITGTSRGNLTGTEQFLKDLIRFKEESLNPTPFIFSTYNMVNGALALQTGINGYNQTFVHQGSSFELALFDAQLYFHENHRPAALLVGCYDELTDDYFVIKNKPAWQEGNGSPVAQGTQDGHAAPAVVGEGAGFFLMGNTPQDAVACLRKVNVFGINEALQLQETLQRDLEELQWELSDIDALVLGEQDNTIPDFYYRKLWSLFPEDIPVLRFKPFCGEHECAGGFGVWLWLQYVSGKALPEQIWPELGRSAGKLKKVLYYNHFQGVNHNFLFLEPVCGAKHF